MFRLTVTGSGLSQGDDTRVVKQQAGRRCVIDVDETAIEEAQQAKADRLTTMRKTPMEPNATAQKLKTHGPLGTIHGPL